MRYDGGRPSTELTQGRLDELRTGTRTCGGSASRARARVRAASTPARLQHSREDRRTSRHSSVVARHVTSREEEVRRARRARLQTDGAGRRDLILSAPCEARTTRLVALSVRLAANGGLAPLAAACDRPSRRRAWHDKRRAVRSEHARARRFERNEPAAKGALVGRAESERPADRVDAELERRWRVDIGAASAHTARSPAAIWT